jgi:anti-anti-sigma factor
VTNTIILPAETATPGAADGEVSTKNPPTRSRRNQATRRSSTDVHRFRGGAVAQQTGGGPGWVSISLRGELDVYDRHSIVDVLTYYVIVGARTVHIDASGLSFIDLAALRSFDRVRRHLERQGGALTICGARPVVARMWGLLLGRDPSTSAMGTRPCTRGPARVEPRASRPRELAA